MSSPRHVGASAMLSFCSSRGKTPIKNVLVLGSCTMLLYMAYNCSVSLLSSLNIHGGLGVASQSVFCSAVLLGSATLPPLLMKVIGVKRTICIAMLLYTPYIGANFYPSWYTFIPFAFLLGLAAGPLWASSLAYLAGMAKIQAKKKQLDNSDDLVFFYIGLLFMFLGLTNIFGNILSFFVLRPGGGHPEANISLSDRELCGVNFCDWTAVQTGIIQQPPQEKVWLLTSLFVTSVLLAAILSMLLLDPLDQSRECVAEDISLAQLVLSPLRRFKMIQHWYLVPITFFAGYTESFLYGDYTKAYVACNWGIYNIGLSMIACGLMTTLSSPFLGWVVKVLDRAYIFAFAGLVHASGIVVLWTWTTDTPHHVIYVVPAIWGFVIVVWQSQVRGLYAILFPDSTNAAFAVEAFLESTGLLTGFAISSQVCTEPKLILLSVLLVVSLAGYAVAEYSHRRGGARTTEVRPDSNEQDTRLGQFT